MSRTIRAVERAQASHKEHHAWTSVDDAKLAGKGASQTTSHTSPEDHHPTLQGSDGDFQAAQAHQRSKRSNLDHDLDAIMTNHARVCILQDPPFSASFSRKLRNFIPLLSSIAQVKRGILCFLTSLRPTSYSFLSARTCLAVHLRAQLQV